MNSTEKTLIFIAGSVMIVSGLFGVMSWSDRTGKLYGFGSWGQYAVAGHWWVLLFVGLIFSFSPLLSGPNNSKGVDQRLVRMAADLKKLKSGIVTTGWTVHLGTALESTHKMEGGTDTVDVHWRRR